MKFEKVSRETWNEFFKNVDSTEALVHRGYRLDDEDGQITQEAIDKAYDNIKLPRRATAGSAGYDFYAPIGIYALPVTDLQFSRSYRKYIIPTGIKVDMSMCPIIEHMRPTIEGPIVYTEPRAVPVLQLYPRSSYGTKYGMSLLNTVGIIDKDYYNNPKNEGHIIVMAEFHDKVIIEPGDAFCQGVFTVAWLTENDEPVESERTGGFGSTDKK